MLDILEEIFEASARYLITMSGNHATLLHKLYRYYLGISKIHILIEKEFLM
jgi:hypothetical protein